VASASATFTIFATLAIPGTVLSLTLASMVLRVDLQPSAAIVAAMLLTSSMATSVGYAIGHAIPEPRVTNLLSNLLLFLVLLFSPIVVAIEQFPDWWGTIHRVLPFWHMAVVLRAGVTEGLVTTSVTTSYAVLTLWVVGSWALVGWAVARRR
jgi:ABC-2 type transport system permease protein